MITMIEANGGDTFCLSLLPVRLHYFNSHFLVVASLLAFTGPATSAWKWTNRL